MQKKYKRSVKHILMKKGIQLKWIKLIAGTIILVLIGVELTVYGTFRLMLGTSQLGRYAENILPLMYPGLHWWLIGEAGAFILIASLVALKISHKVAGPLYRIEKILNQISEGNPPEEIKIRRGDDLWDLVGVLNRVLKRIK